MFLKLASTYTDPDTGTPLPDAILVIIGGVFNLNSSTGVPIARIYANATAYQNARTPVWEGPLPFSSTEVNQQAPALLQAAYTVLAARPQFSGSSVVTP